jgi:hypothetical protein
MVEDCYKVTLSVNEETEYTRSALKFPDLCEKINKNIQGNKIFLYLFKLISECLNKSF